MAYNGKKVVALLPMKANSSRVPGKNFKMMAGKPLFRWILDSLLSVEAIDQVVINTDARHILAENGLVENDRVIIRDRKAEICGDEVSMNLVLNDDVENVDSDIYMMTHNTNPMLQPATINAAIEKFASAVDNGEGDSLFTVTKIQTRFYTEDCKAVNHDPDNLIPTQDLPPWFEENSNLYIFSKDSFAKTNARIGAKPRMLEMEAQEAIDIDVPADWAIAEAMAFYYQKQADEGN